MAMTMATRHLGVGATYSATYNAPFNIARLFATMDHFTEGRVDLVTPEQFHNYGLSWADVAADGDLDVMVVGYEMGPDYATKTTADDGPVLHSHPRPNSTVVTLRYS